MLQWVLNHFAIVLGVTLGAILLIVVITAVLLWLSSRGKFMLVDGIAKDCAAVVEPWKAYREPANGLFLFRLAMFVLMLIIFLATVGVSGWLAWPWFTVNDPNLPFLRALVVVLCVLPPIMVLYFHAELINNDFVVPRMIASGEGVLGAWGSTFRDVIYGRFWKFLLFYVMRGLLWIVEGSVMYMVFCITCCVAAIPYLTQVILLPVFVFDWCYALYFVRQLGEGWNVFPMDYDAPRCPRCDYDLRGNPSALSCPECGCPLTPVHEDESE